MDKTWRTSVSQWMGTYWDTVIDLWTAESGKSDLILSVRVHEAVDGYRFAVNGLYVP